MPVAALTPVAVAFVLTCWSRSSSSIWSCVARFSTRSGQAGAGHAAVRDGDLSPAPLAQASGEIGCLTQHFDAMAGAIRAHRPSSRPRCASAPDALHRLARIDPLTNPTNRRGMTEMLEPDHPRGTPGQPLRPAVAGCRSPQGRSTTAAAMVAGDETLTTLARVLEAACAPTTARHVGEATDSSCCSPLRRSHAGGDRHRVRADIEHGSAACGGDAFTVTIGACLAEPGGTSACRCCSTPTMRFIAPGRRAQPGRRDRRPLIGALHQAAASCEAEGAASPSTLAATRGQARRKRAVDLGEPLRDAKRQPLGRRTEGARPSHRPSWPGSRHKRAAGDRPRRAPAAGEAHHQDEPRCVRPR